VKISYVASWREGDDGLLGGQLEIGAGALTFHPHDADEAGVRELRFDEIDSLELRPPEERPTLVLRSPGGRVVELESAVDRSILGDLLEHAFAHGLRAGGPARRVLVALRLKPGCRPAALELLRRGPPFEPGQTRLIEHDVYVLGDEVLFVFVTAGGEELSGLAAPDFWVAAAAWRPLMAGGIRLAESAYLWTRERESEPAPGHPGLGL